MGIYLQTLPVFPGGNAFHPEEEAEEEWDEAEEVLNRLVELGCKPAELQELMKTIEFPFYDDPKQRANSAHL